MRVRKPHIKKKGKIWFFRLTLPNGKRQRFKFDSYEIAYKKLNDILNQKVSKTLDISFYRVTIQQGMEYFLRKKVEKGLKPKSIERYREMLSNFIAFVSEKKSQYKYPDEITRRDISDFVSYERIRGLSPRTVNDQLDTVSDFYNMLMDDEYLDENPVRKKKHKLNIKRNKVPVTFTEEEFHSILKLAKNWNHKIDWFEIFLTAGLTGLRKGEITFLTWADLKLEAKTPHIIIKDTKTNTPKVIPIHPQLKPYLEGLKRKRRHIKWVFPSSKGKPMNKNQFNVQLKKICNKLNISKEKAHLHTFRRTFASLSRMKGLDSEAVQKIGAWKDRSVMERYYLDVPAEWVVKKYFDIEYLQSKKEAEGE
jgi:integrase/recombinase XerC